MAVWQYVPIVRHHLFNDSAEELRHWSIKHIYIYIYISETSMQRATGSVSQCRHVWHVWPQTCKTQSIKAPFRSFVPLLPHRGIETLATTTTHHATALAGTIESCTTPKLYVNPSGPQGSGRSTDEDRRAVQSNRMP